MEIRKYGHALASFAEKCFIKIQKKRDGQIGKKWKTLSKDRRKKCPAHSLQNQFSLLMSLFWVLTSSRVGYTKPLGKFS